MSKAYLVLENGDVFEGEGFGAPSGAGRAIGELVFTTNMVGYIETLTDPSYYGQIVMQTFPLIGNYGIIEADFEGECCVKGYVVREWCETPSNFRCQYDLDKFLKDRGIPGICGVDTRAITRIIRDNGVMNAMICETLPKDLDAVKAYKIVDAVKNVSTCEETHYPPLGEKKYSVTLIDYGVKKNIVRELNKRGCEVNVVSADMSAESILVEKPDGVVLSNGPGDPSENTQSIAIIRALLGKVPMFGICLGHQLLALAAGGKTEKLKYGHRGGNQPVRDVNGVRTYITSQNHGYAVISESLPAGKTTYINANDHTCEGVDYPEYQAFSVQFHPEACTGPHDTSFLFDRFVAMMGGKNHAAE